MIPFVNYFQKASLLPVLPVPGVLSACCIIIALISVTIALGVPAPIVGGTSRRHLSQ